MAGWHMPPAARCAIPASLHTIIMQPHLASSYVV
jgi:hypothetical protein